MAPRLDFHRPGSFYHPHTALLHVTAPFLLPPRAVSLSLQSRRIQIANTRAPMLRPVTMFRVRRCGRVFCHWASCVCRMNCSCAGVSFSRVGSMRWARGASPLFALRGSPAPDAAILPLRPSQSGGGAGFAGNSSPSLPRGTLGAVVRVFFHQLSAAPGLRERAGET